MKPTIAIITVLLLALLASCGGGKADRRMDLADSLMEENPDSAYAILQAIDSAEISGDSRRARHALLTTQARVKTDRLDLSDTAALPLLDYYTDHGSDFDRMRAAFYKAEIYAMTNNFNHQIRNLIEAEEIAAKLDDIYWLAKIFEGKSLVYNNTGYHQESINCDRAAINFYHSLSKKLNEAFLYCDIALSYSNLSNFEKSQLILDSLQLLYPEELAESDGLQRYMLDLKVSNLIGQQKISEADSVNRLFQKINPNPDFHQLMNSIYIQIYGDTVGLGQNLSELRQRAKNNAYLSSYFYMRYHYDCRRGDWPNAKNAMDSALFYQNLATHEALKQSVISTQLDMQTVKSQALTDANHTYLYIIGAMTVILFLVSISIISYRLNNQRKQNKKDALVNEISARLATQQLLFADYQNTKESEIAGLNQKLSQAKENTDNSLKSTLSKVKIYDIFSTQSGFLSKVCLRYLNSLKSSDKKDSYNRIIDFLHNLNSESSIKKQEQEINRTCDNLFIKFKQDFPKFYRDDLGLLILLMAKTKPRLIAIILQKPEQTIYTKQKRIADEIRNSDSEFKNIYLTAFGFESGNKPA